MGDMFAPKGNPEAEAAAREESRLAREDSQKALEEQRKATARILATPVSPLDSEDARKAATARLKKLQGAASSDVTGGLPGATAPVAWRMLMGQ